MNLSSLYITGYRTGVEAEIRHVTAEEFLAFVRALEAAAGRHLTVDALADARGAYALHRALAAFDDHSRLIGATASDLLELTVPGQVVVPVVRVTLTGVLPTHRGTGLASRMLRQQLHECAARGEAIMVATTSAPGLLQRLDYGAASVAVRIEAQLPAARRFGEDAAGTVRLLDPSEYEAVLPEAFERHRRRRLGQVNRSAAFWQRWLLDRELLRTGPSERFAVSWEDVHGIVQGYLTYRLAYGDLREQPVHTLVVEDLIDVTDRARRELWRFALSFHQATVLIAGNVAADEALPWLVDDRRRLRVTGVRDFLWVRLLDVAAALRARKYAADGCLVLRITDHLLPFNDGCYRVEADVCSTHCERTDAAAELTLDVADLAAAYLGKVTFASLAAAGRVTELAGGAIDRADGMFRCARTAWTVSDW